MRASLEGPRQGGLSVSVLVVSLCLTICLLCRAVQLPWASRQWRSLQRLQQGQRDAPIAALQHHGRSLGPRRGLLAGELHEDQEMGHVELPVQRGVRHCQPVLKNAVGSTVRN